MSKGGFSKARLKHMRQVLSGHVERGMVPGMVTLIARRGEVHVEALGAQGFGGAPMRRDTIFRIASMTKPIVAVAAMMLVEDCKLALDEPLDLLLPELADRKVLKRPDGPIDEVEPARRPLTLRDLLTFRLGWGAVGVDLMGMAGLPIQQAMNEHGIFRLPPGSPHAPDEWMRRLGTLPLIHQPGEVWMYHTGYDVLGVLIARVCGQPLGDFLKDRIFDPLGMKDTGFTVPPDKLKRLSSCYHLNLTTGGLEVFDDAKDSQWRREPVFPQGGGGLVSTADDYLAFGQMLLNKGVHAGGRLLSRPTVEAITSDQITQAQKDASPFFPDFWDTWGWGLGVSVVNRRNGIDTTPGQFGWDGVFGTSWRSDPAEDMVGVMLAQRMDFVFPTVSRLYTDFWTSAYQAIDD